MDSVSELRIMTNLENLRNQFAAVLSRDEMKNVMGGHVNPDEEIEGSEKKPCDGKNEHDSCEHPNGRPATCIYWPMHSGLVCFN